MEASTAPAIPACQSLPSISATACGRVAREVAGNTARATPAASALASAPPMRVVFFVAVAGKPRSCVASASLLLTPTAGARDSGAPPSLRPQPATAAATSRSATRVAWAGRSMGANRSVGPFRPSRVGHGAGLRRAAICPTCAQESVQVGRVPARNAESPGSARGTGDPIVGASPTMFRGRRGSFRASPSANPAGRRKRLCHAGHRLDLHRRAVPVRAFAPGPRPRRSPETAAPPTVSPTSLRPPRPSPTARSSTASPTRRRARRSPSRTPSPPPTRSSASPTSTAAGTTPASRAAATTAPARCPSRCTAGIS